MKLVSLIGILVMTSLAQADFKDDTMAITKKCQAEVKSTTEELTKYFKGGMNPADVTPAIKCHLKCVMENRGILINGVFDNKAFIEKMANFPPMKDVWAAMTKIATDCKGEKGTDACETAFKVIMCFKKKKEEQGIKCDGW